MFRCLGVGVIVFSAYIQGVYSGSVSGGGSNPCLGVGLICECFGAGFGVWDLLQQLSDVVALWVGFAV